MSYPTILPTESAEAEGTAARAFQTAVSSVVLRSLALIVLISTVA